MEINNDMNAYIMDTSRKIKNGHNPLNEINTLELLNKINDFKKIDLKTISDEELNNRILSTINVMLISSSVLTTSNLLFELEN